MLPDFGWTELLVVAIVLIVVVGPKDLPKMLRTFGKTTSSLRKMAGDFRKQFEEALKEAELDDVRQIANDLKGIDPRNQIKESLGPLGKIGRDLNEDLKRATKDFDAPAKPKSKAEEALDSAGEKMRAAQAKPDKAEPGDTDAAKPDTATPAAGKPAAKAAKAPVEAKSKTAARKPAAVKAPVSKTAAAKAVSPKPAIKPAGKAAGKIGSKTALASRSAGKTVAKPSRGKS